MLTQSSLKNKLHYNKETGHFTWLVKDSTNPAVVVGGIAGSENKKLGYVVINLDGVFYYAHRLAFLYETGSFPKRHVDHYDHNGFNNAWSNIRPATVSENMCNTRIRKDNKSGVKGVTWHKAARKWCAEIRHNKVRYYLGLFDEIDDAAAAVAIMRSELHKGFSCNG